MAHALPALHGREDGEGARLQLRLSSPSKEGAVKNWNLHIGVGLVRDPDVHFAVQGYRWDLPLNGGYGFRVVLFHYGVFIFFGRGA